MAAGDGSHWAYQAVKRPTVPEVRERGWPRNGIDRFILANLEAHGLRPAPDADPAVLVRRVYFDLTGLPPSPGEIDAFLKDSSDAGYTRLVDRLLASPEFGQRWGRHWLDVARFGESLTLRGFVLQDAWRYRDYVIDSFNQDRPYDQFMQEQVAGDLLPSTSVEQRRRQLIGSAFLMLGNFNLEEQDKKQLEMDVVDEQIGTIGTAFLAQTIGCARCHDHKFDPISTRDYYALAGILHSTIALEHGNVSKWLEIPLPMDPADEKAVEAHEAEIAALAQKIARVKSALAATKSGKDMAAVGDIPGIVVDDSQARQVGAWRQSTSVHPFIGSGYLTDDGKHDQTSTVTFQPDIPETARYEVRFAYTAGTNRASNVRVTVFSADGEKTIAVDERKAPPIESHFISLGQYTFDRSSQGFVMVSNEGADGDVTADAVQFVAPEAASVAAAHTTDPTPDPQVSAEVLKRLAAQMKTLVETGPKRDTVISVRESNQAADAHINIRGNAHALGDVVPRGVPQVLAVADVSPIPENQSGRLQLAQWLADPHNPLPARVMANRTWHWLFGAGLVRTTDNFGATGELPSNPQLLDFMASEFVEKGWSVKSLVRQIVLSHAYRIASTPDERALAIDPENRLQWRANRRRLDAECLRDAMLAISGQLDRQTGGTVFKPGLASDFGYKQTSLRRSVYLPAFRNAMPEIFQVFDFADPSVSNGRRNVSTVATQALFMMNNPFVLDQSAHAASRLLDDPQLSDDRARSIEAYRLTLGRLPTEAEMQMTTDFVKGAADPHEAWTQVMHALFASMDFRYEE